MAIESTNFFSFLQQTRSPIGLVDQYNLSEIYASDQEDALRNLLLNPEGLNQIFGLSGGDNPVIKEDIRLIGGLESPVVESLGLFHETRDPISFDLSTYVRVGADVGEPGKQSFVSPSQSDNILVYHGGFAAKNIEYNYLDINGEPKTTSVSTSRESLFNSQADNDGNYTSASYPGSVLRVRRRGHFNEIKLNKKLFVEKSVITESPGAIMKIPTYVRTTATPAPAAVVLDAYATKNSPLEVPIKVLGSGSFSLGTVTAQNEAYYFGYEIKRKRDNAVVTTNVYLNVGGLKPASVSVSFNLNGTIGNNEECVLLIYCSPSKIKMLNLAGLGIKETAGKDIGLVGFDALEEINLSSNGLKNIPTWLKVNYKTLRTINLRGNSFWNNGPIEYFDHQDSIGKSGSSSGGAPLLSATQILSYSGYHDSVLSPKLGVDANRKIEYFDGSLSTIVDGSEAKASTTDATKFVKGRARDVAGSTSCTVDEEHGFRVFSAVESLSLGSAFRFRNADFSKIFPNLLNLDLSRGGSGGERVYGSVPKIFNNESSAGISYNLNVQTNVSGNIRWMGDNPLFEDGDTEEKKKQFIGQFRIKYWNTNYNYGVSGGICTDSDMVGGKVTSSSQDGLQKYSLVTNSGGTDAAVAWSNWLDNLESLNVYRSDVAVNLAEGLSLQWKKLNYVQIGYTRSYGSATKIKYNQAKDGGSTPYGAGDMDAYDKLYANSLTRIEAWSSGWAGRLFSIADNAESLTRMQLGSTDWDSYTDNDGNKYILPDNFVKRDKTNIEEQSKLTSLSLHNLISGSSKELQFRPDEFTDMGNLTYLEIRESYYWGVFPQFVNQSKSTSTINCYLGTNRFYDLQNLGANVNNRFGTIWAPNQGISRGGAIIPSFDTGSDNNPRLYNVQFYNSLYPTYSSSWNVSSKRSKIAFNALKGVAGVPTVQTSVDPVAWGDLAQERDSVPTTFTSKKRNGSQASSRVLYADTDTNLRNYVRVGDDVYTEATGGAPIGKVCQIKDTTGSYVVITDSKNYTNKTLYFQRAGINVKEYWNNCTALRYLYFYNCSMVGVVPEFEGNSGKLERVRFQNNLFTTYKPGTLANITGQAVGKTSRPRLREFNLSNNPLSLTSIRNIISDAYSMAKYFGSNLLTITIDLRNTKANIANGTLSNYTDQEVFYLGSPGNPTSDPPIAGSPDPLLSEFNQLGSGNIYSRVNIILN